MKSGFIAIVGKPNAGKSSLMNALIGEKVSIVSPRAQTTRDKILGILTENDYQMIFVDTPGVHSPKSKLGEFMAKAVISASDGVDAVVIVLDSTKKIGEEDLIFIEKYLKKPAPVYIVVNKTDLTGYETVYPVLTKLSPFLTAYEGRNAVKEIIPVSCRTSENVEILKKHLIGELKTGEKFFPSDEITDKSERYMICEIVREKALLYLQDEIPHGVGAYVQTMSIENKLAVIEIDILCEKDSHKPIIIGKDGEKLKTIGEKARIDIEKMLGLKVYLKLFVKVKKDWRNKKSVLSDLGYN